MAHFGPVLPSRPWPCAAGGRGIVLRACRHIQCHCYQGRNLDLSPSRFPPSRERRKGTFGRSTFNLTTASRPGQTHRSAPTVVAGGTGQTHRSAPTKGPGPYAMANQRAQSRDRSGLGLGAGSSRMSNLSYLVSQAQGSRASSMRRGSGMSPFSLTLSR